MKISQALNLGKSQSELDFVDIDLDTDTPLFLDPTAFHNSKGSFAEACSADLTLFFESVLFAAMENRTDLGVGLLAALREPNETQLGLSVGPPRGRGLGGGQAREIFERIRSSRAARTGLLSDLTDVAMFVQGVGADKVSDMTTNIIRRHLIKYSQEQFANFEIPINEELPTGLIWSAADARWESGYDLIPQVQGKKILLVPKRYVRWSRGFGNTRTRYYDNYVAKYIEADQLNNNGNLVRLIERRDGRIDRVVLKGDIKQSLPPTKDNLAAFSSEHQDIYQRFKEAAFRHTPVPNRLLASLQEETFNERNVIEGIIAALERIPPGLRHAADYESLITGVCHILFYPDVTNPVVQRRINNGRKIIDISFDNAADSGFFFQMRSDAFFQSREIMIECKNYSRDIANPEFDQLLGRFDPRRGRFGLMVCRSIDNVDLAADRTIDSFRSQAGAIICVTDQDIIRLLRIDELDRYNAVQQYLRDAFRRLMA